MRLCMGLYSWSEPFAKWAKRGSGEVTCAGSNGTTRPFSAAVLEQEHHIWQRWREIGVISHMLDEHSQEEKLCFFFLHCGLVVGFPHEKKQGGVKSMHSPKQQPQMQWKAQLRLFLTTHPITARTDWTLQSINENGKCWERKRDIEIYI